MNFNGKYWHKPGHLGMTTDEVKKALKALPTPEAGDAGKAVLVNEDADGYELGATGGDKLYAHYIQLSTSSLNANLILITKSETAFTLETLASELAAYTNAAPFYGVSGIYGNTYNVGTGNGVQLYAANSIYVSSGSLYVKINTTKIPVTDTASPGTNITFTSATGIIDEVKEI